MRKNILLPTVLLALAACHSHRDSERKITGGNKTHLIRFNPPVGATYHYEMTSETFLTARGGEKDVDMHNKSDMAVNYQISKDSDELVLEMNCKKIHIYERNGDAITDVDAGAVTHVNAGAVGASNPESQLLAALKAAAIFVRVHPVDFTVAVSGGVEVVDPVVERFYADPDKAQARTFWQQWVEQEVVWKNLDPLTRSFPDSAQRVGDRWTISSTNREDINFKVENNFQLESINAGIATIRSLGRVSNDKAGTWLMDKKITGDLSGKEESVSLIDTASGMPISVQFSVNVGGTVEISGREVRVKIEKTTKMEGKKIN